MQGAVPTVAVIGCGYWGKNIVRNFAGLGALAAVSDPFPANAEAMARQFSVPALALEAILADPSIRGVAIAAPAPLHADIALRCLDAGKHVFVEKPIALSLADADRMIARAAARDRLLMVGHLLNYHPAFLKVAQMVADGAVGSLRRLYSNRLSLGKVRTDENVLWSFAPHDVSMILRLAGNRPPVEVSATGAACLSPGIADFAHAHMTFDDGLTAHVFVSWLNPFKEQKLVVIGESGMIVFDDTLPAAQKVALYRHAVAIENGMPQIAKADAEFIAFDEGEPLRNECRAFLDGMDDPASIVTDGAEGRRVLDVLSRAEAAMAAKVK